MHKPNQNGGIKVGGTGWTPTGFDASYQYSTTTLSVYWPRTEHAKLLTLWPQLADQVGATWDEHRQRIERHCAVVERTGHAVNQLPGTVEDLATFLAQRGITDPSADDLLAYPDLRTATVSMTPWPPTRTEACWCGTGRKYKQCCRPHSLGSLD
ncbi:MAG: hypothetical protein GEU86_09930 [Actinophytocola sp.]|nr:hypothetical protein [Actinophytocola sp.]